MFNAKAYSASSATSPLAPTVIARRDPSENDVEIEILFCGICHSDLHMARNEWSSVLPTVYEDASSFARAFRGWEGVPPGHWRDANREITVN